MKIQNRDGTVAADVDPGTKAVHRIMTALPGIGFSYTGITGAFAGGVPAVNTAFWAMRNGLSAPSALGVTNVIVDRIRLKIVGTNVTAGTLTHRLGLFRGTNIQGVAPPAISGGTAGVGAPKHPLRRSNIGSPLGTAADIRISATAALTTTNITFETTPFRSLHYGYIQPTGAFGEITWEFHDSEHQGLVLSPGQVLAIRMITVTSGTSGYSYQVDADWREVDVIPLPRQ